MNRRYWTQCDKFTHFHWFPYTFLIDFFTAKYIIYNIQNLCKTFWVHFTSTYVMHLEGCAWKRTHISPTSASSNEKVYAHVPRRLWHTETRACGNTTPSPPYRYSHRTSVILQNFYKLGPNILIDTWTIANQRLESCVYECVYAGAQVSLYEGFSVRTAVVGPLERRRSLPSCRVLHKYEYSDV